MKRILTLAAVVSALACTVANAAILTSVKTDPAAYSLYIDGAPQNGGFDTVIFKANPDAGLQFTAQNSGLQSGAPRPAGQAFSYRNRILDLDPTDPDNPGGLGWTILGAISNTGELSFTGGPLGAQISTANQPGGRLFLANVNMPAGVGTANVQLLLLGQSVANLTIPIGIPEPASFGLVSMGLLGLAALRRRS